MAETLTVHDMTVCWRSILDLGALDEVDAFRGKRELVERLVSDGAIPTAGPMFEVLDGVGRKVCALIHNKSLSLPLWPIEVAGLKDVHRMNAEQVAGRLEGLQWQPLEMTLLLHRSGVAMVKFTGRFEGARGTSEAIEAVRTGIRQLVIRLPARYWRDDLPELPRSVTRVEQGAEHVLVVTSLRDLTAWVLRYYLRAALQPRLPGEFGEVRHRRCISTTLIELDRTEPALSPIDEATCVERFGRELRGIGSMDLAYQARADRIVSGSFEENLSQDEELRLYLLGLSDLLIYDPERVEPLAGHEQQRLGLDSQYQLLRYIAYHYACLLDWLYLERYLIEMYDLLLSRSMSRERVTPGQMLDLQRSSMQDLIEYNEGITPFATRADLLERARQLYRLPEEQEKLEKKRDMVTDYVMQAYSLRTNNGIQLLNLFVSAGIAFELMQLVMQIVESKRPTLWGGISSVIFLVVLAGFLVFYQKAVQRR